MWSLEQVLAKALYFFAGLPVLTPQTYALHPLQGSPLPAWPVCPGPGAGGALCDFSNCSAPSACGPEYLSVQGVCVPVLPVAIAACALLVAAAFTGMFCVCRSRRGSPALVWLIGRDELCFPEPEVVLGRGTYGVVVLAEYRGTTVAVKRLPAAAAADCNLEQRKSSRRVRPLDYHAPTVGIPTSPGPPDSPTKAGADVQPASLPPLDEDDSAPPIPPVVAPNAPLAAAATAVLPPADAALRPAARGEAALARVRSKRRLTVTLKGGSGVAAGPVEPPPCTADIVTPAAGSDTGRFAAAAAADSFLLSACDCPTQSDPLIPTAPAVAEFGHPERRQPPARGTPAEQWAGRRRAQLVEEMRLLMTLRHPCVVTLMGAVVDEAETILVRSCSLRE